MFVCVCMYVCMYVCMQLLYLRMDRALAFESCESVRAREVHFNMTGSNILLQKSFDLLSMGPGKGAEETLVRHLICLHTYMHTYIQCIHMHIVYTYLICYVYYY